MDRTGRGCLLALASCLAAAPAPIASVAEEDAAVEAAEQSGDREALRLALRNRGLNAIPAGRLQRGVRSLRRALELVPEGDRDEERALSWMMLGWALQNVGRYEDALDGYARAGVLYRAERVRRPERAKDLMRGEILASINAGTIESAWLGDPSSARTRFERALEAARDVGDAGLTALAWLNLAEASAEARELDRATVEADHARRRYEALRDDTMTAAAVVTQAKILLYAERPEDAMRAATRAAELAETVGNQGILRIARRRQGWAAERLGDDLAARRHYADAVKIVERMRREASLEELQISFLRNKLDIHEGWIRVLHRLRESGLEGDWAREALRVSEGSRYRSFLDNRVTAGDRTAPERPLELEEVQSLLAPGTLLLEYFFGHEENVFLFAVTSESLEFLDLGAPEAIADAADAMAALLRSRSGEAHGRIEPLAEDLRARLIAPVDDRIREAASLIVVPDGPLFHLPFDRILAAGKGTSIRPLSYVPSATVLGAMRRARPASEGEPCGLLGVSVSETAPVDGSPLPKLARARAEIDRASRFFRGARLLHDPDGASMRAALADPCRIVHLAAHARLDPWDPGESGIHLGAGDGPGVLTAREVADFRLPSELVVLSGCSTAGGQIAPGEGLLGLSRAFLRAGSRNVLATLWDVSDETAFRMTSAFYDELARGRPLREALLHAKRRVPEDDDRWAFVLIGEGDGVFRGLRRPGFGVRRWTGAALVSVGALMWIGPWLRRRCASVS